MSKPLYIKLILYTLVAPGCRIMFMGFKNKVYDYPKLQRYYIYIYILFFFCFFCGENDPSLREFGKITRPWPAYRGNSCSEAVI